MLSDLKNIITLRTSILGLLSWLIPFVAASLFFDRTGQLVILQPLFKSLMVVIGGGLGAALLVLAFRRVPASWQTGLALGCYWLFLNLALDLLVLVAIIGMPVITYFYDIGLRYLLIPILSTAMGITVQEAAEREGSS
ncbi:MAG: hypothetical protein HY765_00985 [Rhodomicrobium sp.]|nr:hypothetical protein [Rhodomicrobium sp.]